MGGSEGNEEQKGMKRRMQEEKREARRSDGGEAGNGGSVRERKSGVTLIWALNLKEKQGTS